MPPSLLRSASASAAVTVPPLRGSRLHLVSAVPARAPGPPGGRLLLHRRSNASSLSTAMAKAMPTATAAATPAAASIPGEDLFMVRVDRCESPSSVEPLWRAIGFFFLRGGGRRGVMSHSAFPRRLLCREASFFFLNPQPLFFPLPRSNNFQQQPTREQRTLAASFTIGGIGLHTGDYG